MMKMESLVWGRCHCSVLTLHFSSQDIYIRGDLSGHDCLQASLRFSEMATIIGIYVPAVNINLFISEIHVRIS
jgi:hypothetical protein